MYVLIGITRGDDLFPPERIILLASENRADLETDRDFRERELKRLAPEIAAVPYGVACSVLASFEIVECPTV